MKALQANPLSIAQVFGHEFVIPNFQRPYSWGEEECGQLWEDISSFLDANNDKEKYFCGSIVVYPYEGNDKVWGVIDGQQRLTTLLMLIRALFEQAGTKTILQKMLYKTNPDTGDAMPDTPRLESKVLAGNGRNDCEDFKKTTGMVLDFSSMPKKNQFRTNYEMLREKLKPWWEGKSLNDREKAITSFLGKIVMLPIECDSLDDALTLFQIINDRGMQLNDSDIFKADIYGMAPEEHREDFITRWGNLDDHETLFRIHMHILRAKNNDTGKETGLRPYIKKYFRTMSAPQNWDSVVCSLENYHWIRTNRTVCSDEPEKADEAIFRAILEQYPNNYWCYPLYVFLLKHGQGENGNFDLAKEKQKEYVELLKNTVRYFFIKGVVYNAVNSVKDTAYKVCAAIEHDGNHAGEYRKNIDAKNDLDAFGKKLEKTDYGRCEKGLVWLCSSLNSRQNRREYAKTIRQCHTEHILPRKWNHYDRWNNASHKQDIGKIGNLIPLEWIINNHASNEFFSRKQEEYTESKIQDVVDLSKKDPACWHPEDVKQRQEESLRRLTQFFEAIKN